MNPDDVVFAHPQFRPCQEELVRDILAAVNKGGRHIAHAPTGLGKTAASLAPALSYAREHDKVVFFLTSRHTQHTLAVDTVADICKRHGISITTLDLIGKQNLCPVEGTQGLYSREFSEYCKTMREDRKCDYYTRTRQKNNALTTEAKATLGSLKGMQPLHAETLVRECQRNGQCPYEMSLALSKSAQVVVADYYYIFNPSIRDAFLNRMGRELEDIIVVVDEAHNLPSRLRELLTHRISTRQIARAHNEAKKNSYHELAAIVEETGKILNQLGSGMKEQERLVSKEEFERAVTQLGDMESIVEDLENAADAIREKQKQSSLGSIASFIEEWGGADTGYARILHNDGREVQLSYYCLDPSIVTRPVIENCHSTVLMSGTLTPTAMYRDILGFDKETTMKEYKSPFPRDNQRVLIDPSVTTKYNARSNEQYSRIASNAAGMVNAIPGNCAIFFPSYWFKDRIAQELKTACMKTVFEESSQLSKEDKHDMIERFKSYSTTGAVLLAVTAGSYGEGVDLPGELLNGVLVVGLPLQPPTLLVKELIRYYDEQFGKGWEYGYTLPAIAKSLQNAGRCIRSETDKGVIGFLDNRYMFSNYYKCFPGDWNVKVTKEPISYIRQFFSA